jgi:hypothetical protein
MKSADGETLKLEWDSDPRLIAHLQRREAQARNVHGVVCIDHTFKAFFHVVGPTSNVCECHLREKVHW